MTKSIVAKRREAKATCPKCKSPDYRQLPANYVGGKPNFVCGGCDFSWQYGKDGGIYAELIGNGT